MGFDKTFGNVSFTFIFYLILELKQFNYAQNFCLEYYSLYSVTLGN
jgi:hypothetical protein